MAKENAEKSLNESKYVDKDIEPLGKKLSHHSDDGGVITVDIKQGRFTETIAIPTGFEEEYECCECGEPISEWEYRRYSGCCESCYRESLE